MQKKKLETGEKSRNRHLVNYLFANGYNKNRAIMKKKKKRANSVLQKFQVLREYQENKVASCIFLRFKMQSRSLPLDFKTPSVELRFSNTQHKKSVSQDFDGNIDQERTEESILQF